jgi:hypothetical protein
MSMIGFPLLLIPLAVVNIVVFLMGMKLEKLQEPIVTVGLPSLEVWKITFSDALLAFGLLLLFFEVVKSARPGAKYFTDHLLSFIVFGAFAAEFLMLRDFANSTFFLLTLMAFTDVIAGIAIRSVRPKPAIARAAPAPAADQRPVSKPVAPEPAPQPSPAVVAEAPAVQVQPAETPVTAEQRDVPFAPNQEILPPEPTTPRR